MSWLHNCNCNGVVSLVIITYLNNFDDNYINNFNSLLQWKYYYTVTVSEKFILVRPRNAPGVTENFPFA